ncbi:MDR family NADP-dependent oxidoreductase [Alsobacter soli]|uniref:NADP-dependent oxidoreductase n=1 Tax=Alsobacter soli TaxID=2109933 RepID=UPI0018AD57F2
MPLPTENRQFVLASRPIGEPKPSDFELRTVPVQAPGPGEALLATQYLSLDPYMRGRMSAAKSYARPVEIGQVMVGGSVCEVLASHDPNLPVGAVVLAYGGWQDYPVAKASEVRVLDPAAAPPRTALGVLGMPGMTAYTGLLTIGQPKAGETVVVAAATGPVGSLVGQIARLKGARAVGVAGGPEKCRALIEEFGFDAAVDHRSPDMPEKLAAACPDGIDVYFENVGGEVWSAVFPLLNDFARIPVCGLVSQYNAVEPPPGPDRLPGLMRAVLSKRLTIRGFIVSDFASQARDFYTDVSGWIREGRIRYREDVVQGLENAPEAFIGLLKGRNFGKLLVEVRAPVPA